MSLIIRSAQTVKNGVTLRGNNTQYIEPSIVLPILFEFDASVYSSGTTLLDQSGNDRHATIHGSPAWESDGGGCFVFNANSSKYIEVEGSSGGYGLTYSPAQASFSVWLKLTSTGYYQHVAGWRGGINFWFLILSGTTLTEARFDNGPVYDIGIDYSPYLNTWSQATFVVDAANNRTKLYVNGIEVGSTIGASGNFGGPSSNFTLGGVVTDSFPFNGKIGGSTAYSKALTDAEIVSEFNRTKTRYGL